MQDALFEYPGFTTAYSLREASAGRRGGAGLEFFGTKGSMLIARSGFEVFPDMKIDPPTPSRCSRGSPRAARSAPAQAGTVDRSPSRKSGSSRRTVRPACAQFPGLRQEPPAPHRRCGRRPSDYYRVPSGQPLAPARTQAPMGSRERGNPRRPRKLPPCWSGRIANPGMPSCESALMMKRRIFLGTAGPRLPRLNSRGERPGASLD